MPYLKQCTQRRQIQPHSCHDPNQVKKNNAQHKIEYTGGKWSPLVTPQDPMEGTPLIPNWTLLHNYTYVYGVCSEKFPPLNLSPLLAIPETQSVNMVYQRQFYNHFVNLSLSFQITEYLTPPPNL